MNDSLHRTTRFTWRSFGVIVRGLILGLPSFLILSALLGINTKEPARVMLVIGLLLMIVRPAMLPATELSAVTVRFFASFPWVFIPLVCLCQIARVYVGEHGIDFAIFTQVMRSIRDFGEPTTSLVAPEPVSFLSHHFAPFLFALGWLSRVSLPPHLIGIVFQALSVALAVHFFYKFCRQLGFSATTSGISTTLLCVNPCFRSGISWGIHDEVFALGLVGGALYAWIRQRHALVLVCLVLLTLFKETFFIAVAFSALAAAIQLYVRKSASRHAVGAYALLSSLAFIAAAVYFIVIPLRPDLFPMSFNAGQRLPSLQTLFSFDFLLAKAKFLVALLLPILALPLLSVPGLILYLCASPFWGACLISTFNEMHNGYNYYTVVPTYVAFFASALTVRERWGQSVKCTPTVLFLLSCLAFSNGYRINPVNLIRQLTRTGPIIPDSLSMIPNNLTIVVSEFDAVFVQDKRRIVRLWSAERIPMKWDLVLVRAGTREPPSQRLLKQTAKCYEDTRWTIFCRKGVSLATNESVATTTIP